MSYRVDIWVNGKWEPHFHASLRSEAEAEAIDQRDSGERARVVTETTTQTTPTSDQATPEDDAMVEIADAIGQGVDLRLFRCRGIVSVVLVDSETRKTFGPSAEINLDELVEAIAKLTVRA